MKTLLLVFAMLVGMTSYAQELCGYDDYPGNQKTDADFGNNLSKEAMDLKMAEAEAFATKFIDSKQVVTIPIIFHVVWYNEEENIPDSVIDGQIDVLNKIYSGKMDCEPDPIFNDVIAGDMQIRFVKHAVIRKETNEHNFNIQIDDVKMSKMGGSDVIAPDQYLNVWICDIGGPYAGYSSFPDDDIKKFDGVVMDWVFVGPDSEIEGKILAHEIGHWLGLYHVWGNLRYGDSEKKACKRDDNVKDTPKQSEPHYHCKIHTTSCDSPDIVLNFMDYSECMCMFTHGQKARAIKYLKRYRGTIFDN